MFEKCFTSILYTNIFTENIYKITQETRFDWTRFLNIYKIAEEMKGILINLHFQICSNKDGGEQ